MSQELKPAPCDDEVCSIPGESEVLENQNSENQNSKDQPSENQENFEESGDESGGSDNDSEIHTDSEEERDNDQNDEDQNQDEDQGEDQDDQSDEDQDEDQDQDGNDQEKSEKSDLVIIKNDKVCYLLVAEVLYDLHNREFLTLEDEEKKDAITAVENVANAILSDGDLMDEHLVGFLALNIHMPSHADKIEAIYNYFRKTSISNCKTQEEIELVNKCHEICLNLIEMRKSCATKKPRQRGGNK